MSKSFVHFQNASQNTIADAYDRIKMHMNACSRPKIRVSQMNAFSVVGFGCFRLDPFPFSRFSTIRTKTQKVPTISFSDFPLSVVVMVECHIFYIFWYITALTLPSSLLFSFKPLFLVSRFGHSYSFSLSARRCTFFSSL